MDETRGSLAIVDFEIQRSGQRLCNVGSRVRSRRVNGLCNRQSRPSNLFIDERIAAERIFRTFLVGFRIGKHGPFPCRIPSRPFLVSSLLILARIPWKKLASIAYCRNSSSTRRYWQVSVRGCDFRQIFALFCKTLSENGRRYTVNYNAVQYEFEEARVSRNIWKPLPVEISRESRRNSRAFAQPGERRRRHFPPL